MLGRARLLTGLFKGGPVRTYTATFCRAILLRNSGDDTMGLASMSVHTYVHLCACVDPVEPSCFIVSCYSPLEQMQVLLSPPEGKDCDILHCISLPMLPLASGSCRHNSTGTRFSHAPSCSTIQLLPSRKHKHSQFCGLTSISVPLEAHLQPSQGAAVPRLFMLSTLQLSSVDLIKTVLY